MVAAPPVSGPPQPSRRARVEEPIARARLRPSGTIEDQVRQRHYTPSPQCYTPQRPTHFESKPGGKISSAKVPSALDGPAQAAKFIPGPGSYGPSPGADDFALPDGGRLNRHPPAERLKLDEYPKPGPGAHGFSDSTTGAGIVVNDPARRRVVSGAFGRDPRYTKFIRDAVKLSSGIPAPGTHDVLEAFEATKPFCPEGGRTLAASKSDSFVDKAAKLSEGPAPDRYSLQSAIQPRAASRVVWRFTSETLEESRALVNRLAGGSHDPPGPGAYDMPKVPPISGAPTLKGRSLGHAMPHPFAYNCAPDLCRKFENLAPVRRQNNGDQIFGRDFRRGVGVSATSPSGSQTQPEDRTDSVHASGLLHTSLTQQSESSVQWRSGGFVSLKKSQSAAAVHKRKPELHPVVELASKKYPPFAAKHRSNSAFLPLAHRKVEAVATHDSSEEYKRHCHGKWHLDSVTKNLESATAAVLEPLDEKRMKEDALRSLADKAKERMLLEGVPRDQQELLLAELPRILEEQAARQVRCNHALDGLDDVAVDVVDGFPPELAQNAAYAES